MAKIVYNTCYGGFSLSEQAIKRYVELGGELEKHDSSGRRIDRADERLVNVIEELGKAANGKYANLAIAYVPKGTQYRIDEYDGMESVLTIADYEWKTA